jgi:TATA-box binding protein (TBP) (component of TFIID and TFIIIB)
MIHKMASELRLKIIKRALKNLADEKKSSPKEAKSSLTPEKEYEQIVEEVINEIFPAPANEEKPKRLQTKNGKFSSDLVPRKLPLSALEKDIELEFPVFETIPVSTMTIVIILNITLNIEKLFETLPVMDYIVVPKKRGRKKKTDAVDPNEDVPIGSIITLQSEKMIRGVSVSKKIKKAFRNSITAVMLLENKRINFKLSRNGVMQMTGCKSEKQAEDCVGFVWNLIHNKPDLYEFKPDPCGGKNLKAIFVPAMRNIDFSLGFIVNREMLDEYINFNTKHKSLFEADIGYTGVNIKVSVTSSPKYLTQMEYAFGGSGIRLGCEATPDSSNLTRTQVAYDVYLDMLAPKDKKKKLKKKRVNSFMVFHSGKTIMSGGSAELMRDYYYSFIEMIKSCRNKIEEKLT